MRLMRAPLIRPLVAATLTCLTLSAVPADAGTSTFSASYKVKAGAQSGTSETAREVADIRKVAVRSSANGHLRVVVRTDDVPTPSSSIDGVYSVELTFANGDEQTISHSTDTVSVNANLVAATGLLDLTAEAELTLRRDRVAVAGDGCAHWRASVNHRSDKVVFESSACGGVRFVDEITAEAVAVTTADRRVGYDATGELKHNVRIR